MQATLWTVEVWPTVDVVRQLAQVCAKDQRVEIGLWWARGGISLPGLGLAFLWRARDCIVQAG